MKLTTEQAVATQVYLAYLGRPTNGAALLEFAKSFNVVEGILQPSLTQQKNIFATTEAKTIFGTNPSVTATVTAAFDIVGRVPTAADMAAWVKWVDDVKMDTAQIPWEVMKVALTTESLLPVDKQIAWTRLATSYQLAEDLDLYSNAVNALSSNPAAGTQLHDLVETITAPSTIAKMYPSDGNGTAKAFLTSFDPLATVTTVPKGATKTVDASAASGLTITGEGNVVVSGGNGNGIVTEGNSTITQTLNVTATGNNRIEAGLGADVYILGAGNDTIVVKNGTPNPANPQALESASDSPNSRFQFDTVKNFSMQNDSLALSPSFGTANNLGGDLYNNGEGGVIGIAANGVVTWKPDFNYATYSDGVVNHPSTAGMVANHIFLAMGTAALSAMFVWDNADGVKSTYVLHGDGLVYSTPADVFIELTGVVATGLSFGSHTASTINIVGI